MPRRKVQNPCRGGCGAVLNGTFSTGLCPACRLLHCYLCHERLPEGRVRYCGPCLSARNKARGERPGRVCWSCRSPLPPGRRCTACADCCRRQDALRKRAAVGRMKACRDCGAAMAAVLQRNRCRVCYRAHWWRTGGQKPCVICGHRVRMVFQSWCRPCYSMRQNRRRHQARAARAA